MDFVRTTVRIQEPLKKAAEHYAIDQGTSFQAVLNQALDAFVRSCQDQKAHKIVFQEVDLGQPLDNMTRDDYYEDPKLE